MDGKAILAVIIAFAISLGLLYAIDISLFGGKSDLWQNVIKIVTVLVVVLIAGWITGKVVHKKGLDVKVDH